MTAKQYKGDILILEDIKEMSVPYEVVLSAQGYDCYHIKSLEELKGKIKRKSFMAAYIDIMLDEKDDANRDGLKAMDIIKKTGDGTLCIVVTGFGDVAITRDSLKKYGAYDVIEKQNTDPETFVSLVEEGLRNCAMAKIDKHELMRCLSGSEFFFSWEEHLMSALRAKAGFDSVYSVVPSIFLEVLPILSMPSQAVLTPLKDKEFAYSHIWSRKLGKLVILLFGDESRLDQIVSDGSIDVERRQIGFGRVLRKVRDANLIGLVVEDVNQDFREELAPLTCSHAS